MNAREIGMVAGAIIAIFSVIFSVNAYIYTRVEGEKLENRVDRVERSIQDLREEIRAELRELNQWLREHRKGK